MRHLTDTDLRRWEVWSQPSGERGAGPGRILFRDRDDPVGRSLEAELLPDQVERWESAGGLLAHAPSAVLLDLLSRAEAVP